VWQNLQQPLHEITDRMDYEKVAITIFRGRQGNCITSSAAASKTGGYLWIIGAVKKFNNFAHWRRKPIERYFLSASCTTRDEAPWLIYIQVVVRKNIRVIVFIYSSAANLHLKQLSMYHMQLINLLSSFSRMQWNENCI
jgi:hypothetical protein